MVKLWFIIDLGKNFLMQYNVGELVGLHQLRVLLVLGILFKTDWFKNLIRYRLNPNKCNIKKLGFGVVKVVGLILS